MPSAMEYVPPTVTTRNDFNGEIENERRTRRKRYRDALQYYLGDQPPQLEVDEDSDDPDDNTQINLVQMTADRTVSFLFPDLPKFETDPEAVDDTEEEKWLVHFLEANGGLQSLTKLALRGFLSGHAFLRVKPAPKRKRANKNVYPSMTVLDPTMVSVYWRADDVNDVIWYELRYLVGDVVYIQDFVKDEANDQWLIYTYKSVSSPDNNNPFPGQPTNLGTASTIALDVMVFGLGNTVFETAEKVAIHKSEIPPIIEFPHLPHPDDYYGLGEFTQQNLQDTINRVVSIRNRITRQTAEPVDVMTGADVDDVEQAQGLVTIANPQARVSRLELKGDLAGITTVLDKLIETYLAIARVVLLKGEAKDLQRVTNASVRTLFLDALSKNALLQSSYGHGLLKLARLALAMAYEAGQIAANPATLDIKIKFPTPLPVDDTEVANQNAIMVGLGGRSLRTAATKMGDDWKFELAAKLSEQQLADEQKIRNGEIAAQNAKALSDAVPPQPAADPAAKKPFGK